MTKTLIQNGFHVVGIARRTVAASDLGVDQNQYSHYVYDLADIENLSQLVKAITNDHGVPFGLINNAAIGNDGILPTMHNSDIEKLISVNITSPIVLTKYVSRAMLSSKQGRIINISSVVASTGYRGLSVYAATKSALIGFSKSLARDLGKRNITVNCIAPGFVDTSMTAQMGNDNLKKIVNRSALGRFAFASEIAAGVLLLLSEAGSGITGSTITIDAGNSA